MSGPGDGLTAEGHAESLLMRYSGLFLCAACLAHELGIAAFQGRNLVWRLQALPDYEMRGAKCVKCSYGKRCIRRVERVAVQGTAVAVLDFLLTNPRIYLCDACLAFSVKLGIREVHDLVESLAALDEFDRCQGTCTVCARLTLVTAGVDSDDERTHDADQLAQMIKGTVEYRGWRLDLLSFKTRAGWRPFVVITGPSEARVPDAPSLRWGRFASKIEADKHVLQAARDWIDKRFSQ